MGKSRKWTPCEVEILVKEFSRRPAKEVALFTGHPVKSVRKKANSLGLRREGTGIKWLPWMVAFMKENYPFTKNEDLANWLGVGYCTVALKAAELGLSKAGSLKRPSLKKTDGTLRRIGPEEDAYIRERIGKDSLQKISLSLGFAKSTVSRYCLRKGIAHPAWNIAYSDDGSIHVMGAKEEVYLRKNAKKMSLGQLSRNLGFARSTIRDFCVRRDIVTRAALEKKRTAPQTPSARLRPSVRDDGGGTESPQ